MLMAEFPGLRKYSIRQILHKSGTRIGIRENARSKIYGGTGSTKFKSLHILADLLACTEPRPTFAEIGLRHHVSREYVSQVSVAADTLGLLKLPNSA